MLKASHILASRYFIRGEQRDSLSDTSPMELRPQAINMRDLRMLNPQGMSAINQMFNRSNLDQGGYNFAINSTKRRLG